jgi:hypothetical protein
MGLMTFKETAPPASRAVASGDLRSDLHLPVPADGVVVIVTVVGKLEYGDALAAALHEAAIGTLHIRLGEPSVIPHATITGMAMHVLAAGDWLSRQPAWAALPIGVFGSGVAGGVVLAAAAMRPAMFRAVVSRAGHTQLAGSALDQVQAPTLLIVPGHDGPSVADNQEAMTRVRGIAELAIVAGTSDTLDEPDASTQVARLTRRWFARFLT